MTISQETVYDHFEDIISKYLGERMKTDAALCSRIWSSLANVNWYFIKSSQLIVCGYSFRAAGGMIADIRQQGDYMDWYCSGPYQTVDEEFRKIMKKEGFIADDMNPICDEPGCLEDGSCGFHDDTGYRYTCTQHHCR
jgi:hypothetical protein